MVEDRAIVGAGGTVGGGGEDTEVSGLSSFTPASTVVAGVRAIMVFCMVS